MSDQNTKIDNARWEFIDQLLENANAACDQLTPSEVSDALLFATARFAAFSLAVNSESKEDFNEDAPEMRSLYMDQFRQMINANIDEFADNFKVYTDKE